MKDYVIFLAINNTAWQSISEIALQLSSVQLKPIIALNYLTKDKINWCKKNNIPYFFFGRVNFSMVKLSRTHFLIKLIACFSFLLSYLLIPLTLINRYLCRMIGHRSQSFLITILALSESFSYLRYFFYNWGLLKIIDPKSLCSYVDNLGGPVALLMKACKNSNVKIITIYAAFFDRSMTAAGRLGSQLMSLSKNSLLKRLVSDYFPNQFVNLKGQKLLFALPHETLAMAIWKCLPKNPWTRGGSYSDIVCVDDYSMAAEYKSLGVADECIVTTGHIQLDKLYKWKSNLSKEQVYLKYDLNPNKKLLVLSLVQLKEHRIVSSWDEHWQINEKLVKQTCQLDANLILVLHPKMEIKNYEFLERKYQCKIARSGTASIVPFCDIYISSGSSTGLWALACGAIVMNVKVYNWTFEGFTKYKSVISSDLYSDYLNKIQQLIDNPQKYSTQKSKVIKDQELFVPVNGRVGKNVCSLLVN
ncbi:MAG: hypothetical protein AB8G05_13075 [Oligoflexales bacterium]